MGRFLRLVLAGVVLYLQQNEGRVSVLNLPPDENIYIAGLRTDPSRVRLPGPGAFVSTARGGKLYRMGTASSDGVIDVNSLIVGDSGGTGRSPLTIKSEPTGCAVKISGEALPSVTPTSTSIAAGKEILVEVLCRGMQSWSGYVMAAHGQSVELTAFPALQ